MSERTGAGRATGGASRPRLACVRVGGICVRGCAVWRSECHIDEGEEVVDGGGGEAFDGIGGAVVDFDGAVGFGDHAAGEDGAASEALELVGFGGLDEGLRGDAEDFGGGA